MIDVTFHCSGCYESVTVRNAIRRTFQSFSGKGYGLGTYSENSVEDAAPEGWVVFDPYTQMTYCPECWAEIVAGVEGDASNTKTGGYRIEINSAKRSIAKWPLWMKRAKPKPGGGE